MATHTLTLTGSLTAVKSGQGIAIADVATINGLINEPSSSAFVMSGTTTNGLNTITNVTVSSPTGAPLSGLNMNWVYGSNIGIPAGTQIIGISGTTLQLSNVVTSGGGTGAFFAKGNPNGESAFNTMGQLFIPGRGVLRLVPGDVVAVGPDGWPILISNQAIGYAGTPWTYT